jgi:pimeloyl-ACP methyl ester carboxylesterase
VNSIYWPGLLTLLFAGLVLAWCAVVLVTARVLTHPPRRTYGWAITRGLPGDPGELVLDDGSSPSFSALTLRAASNPRVELPLWEVSGRDPDGPTVILTHGWGDSRTVMLSRTRHMLEFARSIVLWDMPGHGDAGGTCTLGHHEPSDLLRVMESLDAPTIVLAGFSMGAGVSLVAAAKCIDQPRLRARLRGLIAEAPYRLPITPARNVLTLRGLPAGSTLNAAMCVLGARFARSLHWGRGTHAQQSGHRAEPGFDRVHAARALASAGVPVMVLHADNDDISPINDGRAIAEAASGRLVTCLVGGHVGPWQISRRADDTSERPLQRGDADGPLRSIDRDEPCESAVEAWPKAVGAFLRSVRTSRHAANAPAS